MVQPSGYRPEHSHEVGRHWRVSASVLHFQSGEEPTLDPGRSFPGQGLQTRHGR